MMDVLINYGNHFIMYIWISNHHVLFHIYMLYSIYIHTYKLCLCIYIYTHIIFICQKERKMSSWQTHWVLNY